MHKSALRCPVKCSTVSDRATFFFFPSAGNPVPDPVELERLGGVYAGAVRSTVPRLVGERVVPGLRVADCGHRIAAQRQAHVQSEPGPEQPVFRGPPVQATEDRDQHHRQRFERHVVRPDAVSVSFDRSDSQLPVA